MTLDIAMGGSTNTVLHLLAAAQEAEVPFTMADIDRLSRRVPDAVQGGALARRRPLEDVHHAGGMFAILGELDRAGLIHRDVPTVHAATMGEAIDSWDVQAHADGRGARVLHRRAGRRSHHEALQPERALRRARPGSRQRA